MMTGRGMRGMREGRAAAARRVRGCHTGPRRWPPWRLQQAHKDQSPSGRPPSPTLTPDSSGWFSHVPSQPKYLAVGYDKIITRLVQGVLTQGDGRPGRRPKSCWPRADGGRHAGQVTRPALPNLGGVISPPLCSLECIVRVSRQRKAYTVAFLMNGLKLGKIYKS